MNEWFENEIQCIVNNFEISNELKMLNYWKNIQILIIY